MQRPRLQIRPLIQAAVLAGLIGAAPFAAATQAGAASRRSLSVHEVRAVFARVDADGDGRLGRREADHGGVEAGQFARFDQDADGGLDPEEFVVARHALPGSEPASPDLTAAATRIQAAWRAGRALEHERGPAASRARAHRRAPPVPAPGPSTGPRGGPSYPLEMAGGLPPALGLSRLHQGLVSRGVPGATTLEERARAAQELIQARMQARSVARASGALAPGRSGPGSRVSAMAPRSAPAREVSAASDRAATAPRTGARGVSVQGERPGAGSSPAPRAGPGAGRSRARPAPGEGGGGRR